MASISSKISNNSHLKTDLFFKQIPYYISNLFLFISISSLNLNIYDNLLYLFTKIYAFPEKQFIRSLIE